MIEIAQEAIIKMINNTVVKSEFYITYQLLNFELTGLWNIEGLQTLFWKTFPLPNYLQVWIRALKMETVVSSETFILWH
jgi:hypothetical protein